MASKRFLRLGLGLALLATPATAFAKQPEETAVDPARLTFAKVTVDYIFPEGTYARIMDKTMEAVVGNVLQQTGDIPLRDLAGMSGLPSERLKNLGPGTLKQMMEILDPAYEQRMDLSMRVMMSEMGAMMSTFEPAVRDGLAVAYAKRFDKQQLMELNAFFSTPTGKAFASDSMMLFMDPAVMGKMQEFTPVLMKEMPRLAAKMQQATAHLPPPRKRSDLTEAQRARLAELLGTME